MYANALRTFNARVLIVAPGFFRPEGVHGYPPVIAIHIPAYHIVPRVGLVRTVQIPGREPGDPAHAMELIADVVSRERRAEDMERLLLWLVLDKDAAADVRARCAGILGAMDGWEEVARDLEFECKPLPDSLTQ